MKGIGNVETGRTVGRRRRNCKTTTVAVVGTARRSMALLPGRRNCRCTAMLTERRTDRCTTSKRSDTTSKVHPGTVGPRTGRPSMTALGRKSLRRLTGTNTRSGMGRRMWGNLPLGNTVVGTVRSCTAVAGMVGRRLKKIKEKNQRKARCDAILWFQYNFRLCATSMMCKSGVVIRIKIEKESCQQGKFVIDKNAKSKFFFQILVYNWKCISIIDHICYEIENI